MDIALASVIRVELLWSGKAAAATRADVTWEPEGSGRLLVRRSKTDLEVWPKSGREGLYSWQSMMGESGHAGRAI